MEETQEAIKIDGPVCYERGEHEWREVLDRVGRLIAKRCPACETVIHPLACEQCGEVFWTTKEEARPPRWCSLDCQAKAARIARLKIHAIGEFPHAALCKRESQDGPLVTEDPAAITCSRCLAKIRKGDG